MPSPPIVTPEHVFARLTPRTTRLLLDQGLTTVQRVIEQYPLGLLDIHGFGYKSLREVERCFSLGHYNPPRPSRQ
jgi:hypothetical protein